MSSLKDAVKTVADEIEDQIHGGDEDYIYDWISEADALTAGEKESLFARDKGFLLEKLVAHNEKHESLLELFYDDETDEYLTPEQTLTKLDSLDEWVLYGLGRKDGVDFIVWDVYESDGHLAYVLGSQDGEVYGSLVDTN